MEFPRFCCPRPKGGYRGRYGIDSDLVVLLRHCRLSAFSCHQPALPFFTLRLLHLLGKADCLLIFVLIIELYLQFLFADDPNTADKLHHSASVDFLHFRKLHKMIDPAVALASVLQTSVSFSFQLSIAACKPSISALYLRL